MTPESSSSNVGWNPSLPAIKLPRNARASEPHVGERGECGGGEVDVAYRAADAAVDDLDLDALAFVGDGGGHRDVALRGAGAGARAKTVDEAVAADLSVPGNGGRDSVRHDTGTVQGFSAGDEGTADRVAVLLGAGPGPIVEHEHRDGSSEGAVVVDISTSAETLTVVGHVAGVNSREECISRVVNCL